MPKKDWTTTSRKLSLGFSREIVLSQSVINTLLDFEPRKNKYPGVVLETVMYN